MASVRVDKLAFTLGMLGTSQDRKPTSLPGESCPADPALLGSGSSQDHIRMLHES